MKQTTSLMWVVESMENLSSRKGLILGEFALSARLHSCLQILAETPGVPKSQAYQTSDWNYTVGSSGSQFFIPKMEQNH